jgi:hypothetical protein
MVPVCFVLLWLVMVVDGCALMVLGAIATAEAAGLHASE